MRLPRLKAGGSDPLPLSSLRLRDQRFTVRGRLRRPVRRPSLCYGGTGAVTTPASVASDIDRSNSITVAVPTALATHVPPVLGGIPGIAGRTGLAPVGRGYLLPSPPRSVGFVPAE